MIAYKFLRAGAVGPFSGFAWPEEEWVSGRINACGAGDLPIWLSDELWLAELAGSVERVRSKLVAPRGRLVRRIPEWTPEAADSLGRACARRARGHASAVLRAAGMVGAAEELQAFTLEQTAEADELVRCSNLRASAAVGYAADAAGAALAGGAPVAAYIAACAAAHAADSPDAAPRERAWQARWLRDRLSLA
jgi:hypothetical protein